MSLDVNDLYVRGSLLGGRGCRRTWALLQACPVFPGILGPPDALGSGFGELGVPKRTRRSGSPHGSGSTRELCVPGGVMQSWQGAPGRGTGSIKAVVICISYCKSAAGLQRLLTENFTAEWIVSATLRLWGLLCGHFAALEGWDPS